MAFATSDDIEARWRTLSETEKAKADVLLEDAAVYLSAFVTVDPEDEQQAAALKMVSCAMVQRAMIAAGNDAFGVKDERITADIYSQSYTYANPNGDLYLTSAEKRLLGITSSYIIGIRPVIEPVEVSNGNIWRNG